ncbi:MAG: hypothetical protein KAY59_03705 [Acidobacteria bacterium]|nr:hypothetical protein [Acidobacteriota bacterium]MBP8273506.1 hypothetical protein [Acidobacteriota bacterium]
MRVPVLLIGVLVASAACASTRVLFPVGPSVPAPEAIDAWSTASEACRGASLFSAELRVNGRLGDESLRSVTLQGAVTRGGEIKLLAVAPAGPPIFDLAGRAERATLKLPREKRVLVAPAADIVEALIGLPLAPADLVELLAGCVAAGPATDGSRVNDTQFVTLLGGAARARLQRDGTTWRITAGERANVLVEYVQFQGRWPSVARLSSRSGAAVRVALEMNIGQIAVNTTLSSRTFVADVPPDYTPMTIDELRAIGPLGAGRSGGSPQGAR